MTWQTGPLLKSEVDPVNELIAEAFEGDAVTTLLRPGGSTPSMRAHWVDLDLKYWGKDPYVRRVRVKDEQTGHIVAYSLYYVYSDREEGEWKKMPEPSFPDGYNKEAANTLVTNGFMKRTEIMAGKAYIYLALLVTHPSHRKRGAASILLNTMIQQNQDLRLPIYLEAAPQGLSLYLKHGFEKVDEIPIDLSAVGSSQTRIHICMIRPASFPSPSKPLSADRITISSVADESDYLSLAKVEAQANQSSPLMSLCFPLDLNVPETPQSRANQLIQSAAHPSSRIIKATDNTTGQIVAWAKWNFCDDPSVVPEGWPEKWAPGTNVPLVEHFFKDIGQKRDLHTEGNPHFFLVTLCTLPMYQRKGIASLLLKWGLDIADDRGLVCYLDASPMGLGLYKKFGWKEVDHVDVDLGRWGGEDGLVDRVVCLVRKPRSRKMN